MNRWMDGWTNKQRNGYTNSERINAQIDGWMFIELNSLQNEGKL